MPEGSTAHQTLATANAEEPNEIQTTLMQPSHLQDGDNVLAVEIHQRSAEDSSDISFDLQLSCSSPDRFTFIVMADSRCDLNENTCQTESGGQTESGVNETIFKEVLKSAISHKPAFVVFSGDMVLGYKVNYPYPTQSQLSDWVKIMKAQGIPLNFLLPAWGSHERRDLNSQINVWEAWTSVFDPAGTVSTKHFDPEGDGNDCNYPVADFHKTVYYCDYGNARFWVLNNDCPEQEGGNCVIHKIADTQLQWIDDNLANDGQVLNFFIHHEPAFGTGAHGSDPPLAMDRAQQDRNTYIEHVAPYATMIFSGHEHQYVHRLINNDLPDLPDGSITLPPLPRSFFEVKTGTSGAPIHRHKLDNYMTNAVPNTPAYLYHYAVVSISNNTVEVHVYGWDGTIPAVFSEIDEIPSMDLLYTPVTPCRIVDTRKAGRAIPPGGIRSYNVRGAVASQGGNSDGCPSPKGEPRAVHVNVTAVPLGNGNISAFPFGSPRPNASLVNYRSDAQNVANSATVKTCFYCGKDISVRSNFGRAHVVIDVQGYYYSMP